VVRNPARTPSPETLAASLKTNIMFKRLFQKRKSDGLSKIEYWKKWELFELFDELHKAENLLIDILDKKRMTNSINSRTNLLKTYMKLKEIMLQTSQEFGNGSHRQKNGNYFVTTRTEIRYQHISHN